MISIVSTATGRKYCVGHSGQHLGYTIWNGRKGWCGGFIGLFWVMGDSYAPVFKTKCKMQRETKLVHKCHLQNLKKSRHAYSKSSKFTYYQINIKTGTCALKFPLLSTVRFCSAAVVKIGGSCLKVFSIYHSNTLLTNKSDSNKQKVQGLGNFYFYCCLPLVYSKELV